MYVGELEFLPTRRGWRVAGGQEQWCSSAVAGQDYFRSVEKMCFFPASRLVLLLIR